MRSCTSKPWPTATPRLRCCCAQAWPWPAPPRCSACERSLPHGHVAAVLGSARGCGMMTSARIEQVLKPQGMDWVSSLRSTQVMQLAGEHGPFQPSLFDERNLIELTSEHFPGERLVSRSRAQDRHHHAPHAASGQGLRTPRIEPGLYPAGASSIEQKLNGGAHLRSGKPQSSG